MCVCVFFFFCHIGLKDLKRRHFHLYHDKGNSKVRLYGVKGEKSDSSLLSVVIAAGAELSFRCTQRERKKRLSLAASAGLSFLGNDDQKQ